MHSLSRTAWTLGCTDPFHKILWWPKVSIHKTSSCWIKGAGREPSQQARIVQTHSLWSPVCSSTEHESHNHMCVLAHSKVWGDFSLHMYLSNPMSFFLRSFIFSFVPCNPALVLPGRTHPCLCRSGIPWFSSAGWWALLGILPVQGENMVLEWELPLELRETTFLAL